MARWALLAALFYAVAATLVAEMIVPRGEVKFASKTAESSRNSSGPRTLMVPREVSRVLVSSKTTVKKPAMDRQQLALGWPRVGGDPQTSSDSRAFSPDMLPDDDAEGDVSDHVLRPRPNPRSEQYRALLASITSPEARQIQRDLGFDPDFVETSRLSAVGKGPCGSGRVWKVAAVGPDSRADMEPSVVANPVLIDALTEWEQEVQEAALKYLGEPVDVVQNMGSYVCKRIMNRKFGPWSEHSKANALDISGFETLSGKVITISRHWYARGRERLFLKAVHEAACQAFNLVLGPFYNKAHQDHLHIDMGAHKACH